jgi:hypothetical protein
VLFRSVLALAPLSVLAVGEIQTSLAKSVLAPITGLVASPQTFIFVTEALSPLSVLAASTIARDAGLAALAPAASLGVAETQVNTAAAVTAVATTLSGDPRKPGAQAWGDTAVLSTAAVLSISTIQWAMAASAATVAAALAASPQTYIFDAAETLTSITAFSTISSLRMTALASSTPSTSLAASGTQQQLISTALSASAVFTAGFATTQQWLASALLGPASILGVSTTQMLAGTSPSAPTAIMVAASLMQQVSHAVFSPSNTMTTAAVQEILAAAGLTGSTNLTPPGSLWMSSGVLPMTPQATLVPGISSRLMLFSAMSAASILSANLFAQPSFFLSLTAQTVLANTIAAQCDAARLSLGQQAILQAVATSARQAGDAVLGSGTSLTASLAETMAGSGLFGAAGAWGQPKAGIGQATNIQLTSECFTDIQLRIRRISEISAIVTGQRQVTQTYARRGKAGINGQNIVSSITAKSGFQINNEG